MRISIITLLIFFVGISCCNDDESKEYTYQYYKVEYDYNEVLTTVESKFFVDNISGKIVKVDKANLNVNEESFDFKNNLYEKKWQAIVEEIEVNFRDEYGEWYNNSFFLNDIKPIGFPLIYEIPLSKNLVVSWFGYQPVSINEKVILEIINSQTKEKKEFYTDKISLQIEVPADSLSFLTQGVHKMVLKRQKFIELKQKNIAGGYGELNFSTGEKSFYFVNK